MRILTNMCSPWYTNTCSCQGLPARWSVRDADPLGNDRRRPCGVERRGQFDREHVCPGRERPCRELDLGAPAGLESPSRRDDRRGAGGQPPLDLARGSAGGEDPGGVRRILEGGSAERPRPLPRRPRLREVAEVGARADDAPLGPPADRLTAATGLDLVDRGGDGPGRRALAAVGAPERRLPAGAVALVVVAEEVELSDV